ncbi:MAG: terminase family protein [Rhodospirillaceae bacterium]
MTTKPKKTKRAKTTSRRSGKAQGSDSGPTGAAASAASRKIRGQRKAAPGPATRRGPCGAAKIHTPTKPIDFLRAYQRSAATDDSRFKAYCWPRQVGKDHTFGFEGVTDMFSAEIEGRKASHIIAGPSERQSLDSLDKWKLWCEAYDVAIADVIEEREDGGESLLKSAEIILPGGSKVVAVPGKPDTVRGKSGWAWLTEFAYFENPGETWRALYPTIASNNQFKARIGSTPNGKGNKFADIVLGALQRQESGEAPEIVIPDQVRARMDEAVEQAEREGRAEGLRFGDAEVEWSVHFLTIYDAIAQGLNINPYELFAGLDDAEAWQQEFECEFLDAALILFSYALLAGCEAVEATMSVDEEYWSVKGEDCVLGVDFGRSKNRTVAWTLAKAGARKITRDVLSLDGVPVPEQIEILRPRIQRARRVCFDYTGPGIGMGDFLVKEFGEWNPDKNLFGKVELCTFSNAFKVDVFTKLKMALEAQANLMPISRLLREDHHSLYRVVTPSGNITFKAPHTSDGHADYATAHALANRAAERMSGPFKREAITGQRGKQRRNRRRRQNTAL